MSQKQSVLLENVNSHIDRNFTQPDNVQLKSFTQLLLNSVASDDLKHRSDSDIYGGVVHLWNLVHLATEQGRAIEVFNPEPSSHGWYSSHTIIQVVVPDTPFLVDSIAMAMQRLNVKTHITFHSPFSISKQGERIESLTKLDNQKDKQHFASFWVEVNRQSDESKLMQIKAELTDVLDDVRAAVSDWKQMRQKLTDIVAELPSKPYSGDESAKGEAVQFLDFLCNHNITLLGYRYFSMSKQDGSYLLEPVHDTSLGLMKVSQLGSKTLNISEFSDSARAEALSPDLLLLTKSNSKSTVHRPAYIDYLGIKEFNENGEVIGEHRFLGLYSASIYNFSIANIPLLKEKAQRVLDGFNLSPSTHDYKALVNILETYPRDELIQAKESEISATASGILHLQERDKTKLFVRKDPFGRYVTCLVFVSKERYTTKLRQRTQQILGRYFNSNDDVEFTTYFSEANLARTLYTVKVGDKQLDIDVAKLEQELIEAARSWEDKFEQSLLVSLGEERSNEIAEQFGQAFPPSYKEDVMPTAAIADVQHLLDLKSDDDLGMLFFKPQEQLHQNSVRLKLFHRSKPIYLSDVMPVIENFGLNVIGERPYKVVTAAGQEYWILDFAMQAKHDIKDVIASQDSVQDALARVWAGELENDGFNQLVLSCGLTGREVAVIRAYAKYMRQIDATFSQQYIEETFSRYPGFAKQLVELFTQRFNPALEQHDISDIVQAIEADLDDVASLDDDRIIRRYMDLMKATLRTNFYQNLDGSAKSYISFKFEAALIPEMPLPLPKFEIFVYSPRVEGVHLRGGKVARGGLRWSDRREDFRTEVLGLVKAQQVKNTVIVPVGAKGGFVCKQINNAKTRDEFFAEGQACYRLFIKGLLDVTDNIIKGETIAPLDVVCHDEVDPYLVVAADKGTATFSDIANAISQEYQFWMGDAFASGGSNGYDHKKMGITAKGAWESVRRHFREIGIDCQTTDFTCVAIGDMAGDVFGNGMLLSKHTRLQAAFNHMHIFIDPNPDAASSYEERARLFELPRSSWEDYNQKLISKGGGIFSRSAKSIKLTPEIQAMLHVKAKELTPNAFINAILKMPVDLLWNGGIGTYVKASTENHTEVGDRANDGLRINGAELGARIVGEGGNLGLTQLGRIEFAKRGGLINTDFTDNVGGVDCSDNEVNIKILLGALVDAGDMTTKQRNELLEAMTDEVSEIVLKDCNEQTRAISLSMRGIGNNLKEQTRFIHYLERIGKLDRELENLPNDEALEERSREATSLTRPELSVLYSYAKMVLKEQLCVADIVEQDYFSSYLVDYFPARLRTQYSEQMHQHALKGEIIATKLANKIVNSMGVNFISRLLEETGAQVSDIAQCFSIAWDVFDGDSITQATVALNGKIDSDVQYEILNCLRRHIRRATRWLIRHRDASVSMQTNIERYRSAVSRLNAHFEQLMITKEQQELSDLRDDYMAKGVPLALAEQSARLSSFFSALDLAEVAHQSDESVELIGEIFYKLGAQIELHWFLEEINNQPVKNHLQAMARAAYREELDSHQRSLTQAVLQSVDNQHSAEHNITLWLNEHQNLLSRWSRMLDELKRSATNDPARFTVALRELSLIIQQCNK